MSCLLFTVRSKQVPAKSVKDEKKPSLNWTDVLGNEEIFKTTIKPKRGKETNVVIVAAKKNVHPTRQEEWQEEEYFYRRCKFTFTLLLLAIVKVTSSFRMVELTKVTLRLLLAIE